MTESQRSKILNIQSEISKIEKKIDKLLAHRQLLLEQAERITQKPQKVSVPPSDEARKLQSERDKAAHQARLTSSKSPKIQKLNLFGTSQK